MGYSGHARACSVQLFIVCYFRDACVTTEYVPHRLELSFDGVHLRLGVGTPKCASSKPEAGIIVSSQTDVLDDCSSRTGPCMGRSPVVWREHDRK